MIIHPIDPVFNEDSGILILGSFPSVRSREEGFFYGHPQNRFWKVTAGVFDENVPQTIDEKKAFLLRNHIALWDVIGREGICLPSTSPANAAWNLDRLKDAWKIIR